MTLDELEDAQAALELLGGKGTLLQAAQFFNENYRHTSGLRLQDALTRYLGSKERKKRSESLLEHHPGKPRMQPRHPAQGRLKRKETLTKG